MGKNEELHHRSSHRETLRESVTLLTHSQYYSPAFNAAIFDGPIRIYFAQYQESVALKIYFRMQQRLKDLPPNHSESLKMSAQHFFIMVYPTEETFHQAFGDKNGGVKQTPLGRDFVLGICNPMQDEAIEDLVEKTYDSILRWSPAQMIPPPHSVGAEPSL